MYRIKEIWKTIQGEGALAGTSAVFVRFVGCNMWSGYEGDRERDAERNAAACPRWCDTEFTKEGSVGMTAEEIAGKVLKLHGGGGLVVLTGGEPLLQATTELLDALHDCRHTVAVETNGTVSIERLRTSPPDWITVSPKVSDTQLKIEWCDEVKLVVPSYRPRDYPCLVARVRRHNSPVGGRVRYLWVQPEDGPRFERAAEEALEIVAGDAEWRVSVQGHKVVGAL